MPDIKPIETMYNGYRFRSRLEARWAVFFGAAGIRYEYEPQGYKLSDGTYYLPDFFLPDVNSYGWHGCKSTKGLWVDVKSGKENEDLSKIIQFAKDGNRIAVLTPFDSGYKNTLFTFDDDKGYHVVEDCYFVKCDSCNEIIYTCLEDNLFYRENDIHFHHEQCKYRVFKRDIEPDIERVASYINNDANIAETVRRDIACQLWAYIGTYEDMLGGNTLRQALVKARQARFEHGEHGA